MTDYEKATQELEKLDKIFIPNEEYNPDFQDLCYDIVKELEKLENPNKTIPAILECFERQATDNFGIHAELFLFIEGLDSNQLANEILKSIQRKPVPQTVWLIKKLINSFDDKKNGNDILRSIAENENIDDMTRKTAEMFLSV